MIGRLRRRQAVRVKREHLLVMWALRAFVEPANSLDVARLVNLTPSRIRVHLDWMIEQGHVRRHEPGPDRLVRQSLTPTGEAFMAQLIEDLLATANAWGGARPVKGAQHG